MRRPDTKLSCPACASPMDLHQKGETEVDVCPGCHGLWLDGGELEQIVGAPVAPEIGPPQYRKCPRCREAMARVVLGGAHLERCGSCHGYFLDAGELEQVLGRRKKAQVPVEPEWVEEPPSEFLCAKCQGRFPREKGYAVPGGHVCDKCSGFVTPRDEPGALDRFLERLVERLPARARFYYHC